MSEIAKKLEQASSGPKQEKKEVWQIVQNIYGKNRKAKMPELADKFGICDKDTYIKARDEGKNAEYNIKIGERLQKGERLEPEAINKKIEKFTDPDKQKFLRTHMNEFDQQYVMNMDKSIIDKLNAMEDLSLFGGFLRNQKEAIQEKKNQVAAAGGFEQPDIDNAAVNLELFEFDQNLIAFLSKAKKAGHIDVQDLRNARHEAELKTNAASEEDIKNAGGKEALQRQLERMELLKMAKEKGLNTGEYESEFNDLAVRLYEINKDNEWLQKFWDKDLLVDIKKIASIFERSKETSRDALDKEKNNIMGTEVMQGYLAEPESNLTSIVDDEAKDDEYRKSIKQKYPILQTWIDGVYQSNMIDQNDKKFFEEDTGVLKADTSPEDKARLEKKSKEIQPLLKEKFATVETNLLGDWNSIIKTQAVSTCIDNLRSCMNFSLDDGDKENLLASLTDIKSTATKEDNNNRVVKIKGKVGDKDLTVYYNLTTGTVETQKFLKKDMKAGVYYLADEKNEKQGREEIPGLKLPQLSDFTNKVGSRGPQGRKEILLQSKNLEDMKTNLQTKLDRDVRADYAANINPSHFEKVAVQNIFTQEIMVDFMKFPKERFAEIGSKNPEYFQLCDLVNNAANRYTKDELKRGRGTIKEMKDIKEKNITYHPVTNKREDMKENNPERYFFEMAFCPYVLDRANYRDTPVNNTYLKFFQCFKSPKSDAFPMMDLDMLNDYKDILGKKINREEDNAMARKRSITPFEKNMQETENYIETMAMEDSFNEKKGK